MTRNAVHEDYFQWMYDLVCEDRFAPEHSRYRLLTRLHDIDFEWKISRDANRAEDGMSLRYRFAKMQPHDDLVDAVLDYLDRPCSVLEMMVALALRCEETIMDDPMKGDRTGHWFWSMIVSLGLGSMRDNNFDVHYVDDVIDIFLKRKYEPNGKGGLFTIKNCSDDLRKVEIWTQLCWYLDTID